MIQIIRIVKTKMSTEGEINMMIVIRSPAVSECRGKNTRGIEEGKRKDDLVEVPGIKIQGDELMMKKTMTEGKIEIKIKAGTIEMMWMSLNIEIETEEKIGKVIAKVSVSKN